MLDWSWYLVTKTYYLADHLITNTRMHEPLYLLHYFNPFLCTNEAFKPAHTRILNLPFGVCSYVYNLELVFKRSI